jgi:hypothetical protein
MALPQSHLSRLRSCGPPADLVGTSPGSNPIYLHVAFAGGGGVCSGQPRWNHHSFNRRGYFRSPSTAASHSNWEGQIMSKSTILTDRFDRALLYATHVHGGQVRKGTSTPPLCGPTFWRSGPPSLSTAVTRTLLSPLFCATAPRTRMVRQD